MNGEVVTGGGFDMDEAFRCGTPFATADMSPVTLGLPFERMPSFQASTSFESVSPLSSSSSVRNASKVDRAGSVEERANRRPPLLDKAADAGGGGVAASPFPVASAAVFERKSDNLLVALFRALLSGPFAVSEAFSSCLFMVLSLFLRTR